MISQPLTHFSSFLTYRVLLKSKISEKRERLTDSLQIEHFLPFFFVIGHPENVAMGRLGVVVEGGLNLTEPATNLLWPMLENFSRP
jgi:hypothetical protein